VTKPTNKQIDVVEKMRLSKDQKSIQVNDSLTLAGFPQSAIQHNPQPSIRTPPPERTGNKTTGCLDQRSTAGCHWRLVRQCFADGSLGPDVPRTIGRTGAMRATPPQPKTLRAFAGVCTFFIAGRTTAAPGVKKIQPRRRKK
jgi:hypothetical protein